MIYNNLIILEHKELDFPVSFHYNWITPKNNFSIMNFRYKIYLVTHQKYVYALRWFLKAQYGRGDHLVFVRHKTFREVIFKPLLCTAVFTMEIDWFCCIKLTNLFFKQLLYNHVCRSKIIFSTCGVHFRLHRPLSR